MTPCFSLVLERGTPGKSLARKGDEPPIELTSYAFCCESFEDKEEAELVAPARPKPGRNESCWCGSGKKYKKCHLASDEAAESEFEVRRALADFASRELRPAEMRAALKAYFGRDIQEIDEDEQIGFLEWLIHDHNTSRWGRTPVQEYLRVAQLTGEQRREVESFAAAVCSLLEVQEVQRGTGVRVRDLLQGGEVLVHDVSSSKRWSQWDCPALAGGANSPLTAWRCRVLCRRRFGEWSWPTAGRRGTTGRLPCAPTAAACDNN